MIERQIIIRNEQMNVKITGQDHLPVIVFLHGFTGTVATWDEVMTELEGRYRMVAIDLIGHGKTASPSEVSRYAMTEQLADLEALCTELKLMDFILVGYSMGGRIALAFTEKYPNRVKVLILESASPGLKTEEARTLRIAADLKLANRIQTEGIERFVDFWEEIPLFRSQKNLSVEKNAKVRAERLSQSETGLANSLKGIGTGSQPSYWAHIEKMMLPVLLLTGEIDEKFVAISREMRNMFPNALHETIKNVGHAIHVEKSTLFATMVEEYILKLENSGRQ